MQTPFTGDLDGRKADDTVQFSPDGTEYEIHPNAEHARGLPDALARCVAAARARERSPAASADERGAS